jgi:hypothetical protein
MNNNNKKGHDLPIDTKKKEELRKKYADYSMVQSKEIAEIIEIRHPDNKTNMRVKLSYASGILIMTGDAGVIVLGFPEGNLQSVAKKITQEDWCEEYIYGCVMAIDPKSCLWNGEKALQDAQECIQSRMENDMFPDWKWWKTPIDKFTEDIEDTDCFDSKLQWQIWASKNGAKYFGNMGIDFGNEIPYLVTVVKEALYKISKGGN